MKPELPSSMPRPENLNINAHRLDESLDNNANKLVSTKNFETKDDICVENAVGGSGAQPVVVPNIVIPDPQPVSQPISNVSLSGNNPIVAGDDDLIEKEWIDKAKQIRNDTKDDPYKQESMINELRWDYIDKRFGDIRGAKD